MNLRALLNSGDTNRTFDALRKLSFGDLLNKLLAGGAGVEVPALTSSQNATAAAAVQTGSYVQADVESIRTLANALKISYNALQVDVVAIRAALAGVGNVTEAGLVPSSNIVTLAAVPVSIIDITIVAGTNTGPVKLRKGPVTGSQAILPSTLEAVWDGGLKIRMAAADVATDVNVGYTKAVDATVSAMQQDLDA